MVFSGWNFLTHVINLFKLNLLRKTEESLKAKWNLISFTFLYICQIIFTCLSDKICNRKLSVAQRAPTGLRETALVSVRTLRETQNPPPQPQTQTFKTSPTTTTRTHSDIICCCYWTYVTNSNNQAPTPTSTWLFEEVAARSFVEDLQKLD